MPPEGISLSRRAALVGGWACALCVWRLALDLWPAVPRDVLEATRLAALYALGRS